MDRQALEYYLNIYKQGLLEDNLPFWEKHAMDREDGWEREHGGISVSLKGNLWKGPFHVPRMYYMAWKICEKLLTN